MKEEMEIFFVGLEDLKEKKKKIQEVYTAIKACLAERAC